MNNKYPNILTLSNMNYLIYVEDIKCRAHLGWGSINKYTYFHEEDNISCFLLANHSHNSFSFHLVFS